MRWVPSLWKSSDLALAIDPTTLSGQAQRRSRERGLSRMRDPGRVGPHARQQARQVDRPHSRSARTAVGRNSQRNEGNVGASWYALRVRIETGFKALKSVGRQRRKTRRTNPARVERNRPVLSAATLLTLDAGSRAEDAQALKKSPRALRSPPKAAPERRRIVGVFRLGLSALNRLLAKGGGMWRGVRLLPNPGLRRLTD